MKLLDTIAHSYWKITLCVYITIFCDHSLECLLIVISSVAAICDVITSCQRQYYLKRTSNGSVMDMM